MSCRKGFNWGEEETRTFLELCIDRQIISLMDGKKHKHVDIFNSLVEDMEKKGFSKTAQQMKLKLKNLKLAYYKCKRENNVSGAARKTCPFYEQVDILYSTRPNVQVLNDSSGIDTTNIPNESSCEYTEDCSSMNDSEIVEESESSSTISNEPPKKKKRGLNKFSGRKSYETILDNYTENLMQSQQQLLSDIIIKQNEMQKEMIKVEIENQRLWEKEIIEKEHAFQREQMQSFVQALQAINSQASPSNYGMPQNFFMTQNYGMSTNYKLPQHVKIVPIKEGSIIESSQLNKSMASTSTSSTITKENNNDNSKA
ncbi:unnamed protein product [Lasius platythorax]|uniref:Myb/SANT-like DNA-binding domain-containing protein n=1 Tax=Lasius platythorax TaxID=488582 RepID=A0AAV2MWF3_9HYME